MILCVIFDHIIIPCFSCLGHESISNEIRQLCFEITLNQQDVAKLLSFWVSLNDSTIYPSFSSYGFWCLWYRSQCLAVLNLAGISIELVIVAEVEAFLVEVALVES